MELRHLRYFLAVAETLNFSRAAERLQMAQPPLSQQIRDLERELGVQLFDREKRPLQLTQAGQAFLPEVLAVMQQVEQASRTAQQASRGEIGQLAIGFNSAAMQTVLPGILQQFRQQFPTVELNLCELDSQLQLEQLASGQIDCGFLHAQPRDTLPYYSLWSEPLVVALPAHHPLSNQTVVALATLANETFILPPPALGPRFYSQVLALCEGCGFIPVSIQEARLLQTVLGLVVSGIGIALVPASMQQLQRAGVVYRQVLPTFEIETLLVWQSSSPTPVLKHFIDCAIAQ